MSSRSRSAIVRAPSNIAIIKYMGKTDASVNLPANASLSLTLDSLCTITEVTLVEEKSRSGFSPAGFSMEWSGASEIGSQKDLRPFNASKDAEKARLSRHIERVVAVLRPELAGSSWKIRSGNRFPAGAGIASSASGFAALTLGVAAVLGAESDPRLASLSRQGSGSSCRSFGGPWVQWDTDEVRGVPSTLPPLTDLVMLVDEGAKQVGSSEAHARVTRSPLWKGRPERAASRLKDLRAALSGGDFSAFSRISIEEALDMHELFHTSEPPFSYMTGTTRAILEHFRGREDCALTLDAGPNVHVLVPQAFAAALKAEIHAAFPGISVLEDRQGSGARVESVS